MLLRDFFDRIYVPRRLRGKSHNSVRLYRLCIQRFSETLGRPARLEDLTEDNVLAHLARRSHLAPASRNKEMNELTAMWRLAVQRGMHTGWPDIQKEHEPERDPIAWMPDEAQRLLDTAARQQGDLFGIPAWLWWTGLLHVVLDTAERISAVRYAQWSWLQDEWLRIPAEARKGKTRDRTYRLGKTSLACLKEIRAKRASDTDIFPWEYCETYIWDRYKKLVAEAGLPTGREYAFHILRKTSSSAAHAAGMDAQEVLDHADKRTSQRYLDVRLTRQQHVSDVLSDYLENPDPKRPNPNQNPNDKRDAG